MRHYAVIPSGFRPEELRNLVTRLVADDVNVVIVDTGYDRMRIAHPLVTVVQDHAQPKNIQRWWNMGLGLVYEWESQNEGAEEFIVAVLNDDVVVPAGFVQTLASAIEQTGAAAASPLPGLSSGAMMITGTGVYGYRMAGFAFALRGSLGLLADESFVWWYGDNDLDWQARQKGGVAHVGGAWEGFQHLYPNSTTVGELAEQANRDRETFVAKWGRAPW